MPRGRPRKDKPIIDFLSGSEKIQSKNLLITTARKIGKELNCRSADCRFEGVSAALRHFNVSVQLVEKKIKITRLDNNATLLF